MIAEELIPLRQFNKVYHVGPTKTYELLAEGKLKAVKVGSRTHITVESARAWRESLPVYQPQAAA